MDWKSTILVRAALDLLAIVCALLFVIPLGLLLCGAYTAGCWIAERIRPRTSDANIASIQPGTHTVGRHERVTHMPIAPHEATAGTPLPTLPQPVQHSKGPAEDLAQWTRDLNAYGSLYGVHFTQDQAARLFLYERGLKPAPEESEAEG